MSAIVRGKRFIAVICIAESVGIQCQNGVGVVVEDFDASQERFDYLAASDQASVQVMMSGSDCGLSGVKCCCATNKTEGRSDRRRDPHASGRLWNGDERLREKGTAQSH